MAADTITLQELKTGDIMLFSPTDEAISKLIVFVTHSKVSHTGMVDYNPAYVINEQGEGAMRRLLGAPGERTIYIRRLKNAPDTSKVVDIAMEYVNEQLPYPKSNLFFLGIYVLAGEFIPDTLTGELIKNLLRVVCYELIKLVNEKRFPGVDTPMVCSQFAAFCYDQAALKYGPEYKIHYNDKVATVPSLIRTILDQLIKEPEKTYRLDAPKKGLLGEVEEELMSAEECCGKLLEHLTKNHLMAGASPEAEDGVMKASDEMMTARPTKVSDEVIAAVYQYGRLLLALFGSKELKEDAKTVSAKEIQEVLEELLRFQETFVTPEDLLSNTTNLEDMGILTYTQEEVDERK